MVAATASKCSLNDFNVLLLCFDAGLWNVDLRLTIGKEDIDLSTLDSLAVSGWVEDVADLLAVAEGSVWHLNVLVVVGVGDGDEEFASLEAVEIVSDISLLKFMIPHRHSLPGFVDGSGHLVDIRVGVHALPEGLSIMRVIATSISLLTTVVVEWNTLGSQGEGESTLEHGDVMVGVEETGVVVIVNEDTEGIQVSEMRGLFLKSVLDIVHRLSTEDILNGEVHWIVEESGQVVLVWTDVGWVTIEVLTHLEHTSSISVFLPEIFWNFWDGIDSDTVEAVGINKVLDPVLEVVSNPAIRLVEIWETGETAVLDRVLVTPVNVAVWVIVFGFVQWVDLTEIVADWCSVVCNDIDHDVNTLRVGSFH